MKTNQALLNSIGNGFQLDDLVDVTVLGQEIAASDNPLARHLRAELTQAQLLPLPDYATSDAARYKAALVEQLNVIIGGDSLYTDERFAGVKLTETTRKLRRKNPTGADRVKFHRFLLLDALPQHFRRKPGRGANRVQKPATVHYSEADKKWLVLVRLIEPRTVLGVVRSGQLKFERQTEELANGLCVDINAELCGKEFARQLTPQEINFAKTLFWQILEPVHPEWIPHLDQLVGHCIKTGFSLPNANVPDVAEAVRCYWQEHVSRLAPETQMNYRNAFGYLLPAFGKLKPFQLTDPMIERFAAGTGKVNFWATSYRSGQDPAEATTRRWDTPMLSECDRPWDYYMCYRFLICVRKFKNWMSDSKDPLTKVQRNWCPRSTIKTPKPVMKDIQAKQPGDIDPEKTNNPALTPEQTQALIDVAWVAYGGLYSPFYVNTLWGGTRVKETRKTDATAFAPEEGRLSVPETVDKTKRGREVEIYPNMIMMVEALKSVGRYTTQGLRAHQDSRAVIQILAGFTSKSRKRVERAQKERERLAKLGIELPIYNWGRRFPRNALRRTALSMHFKLFQDEDRTTLWGGNTPGIFKEYYKRLVTREQALEYWLMLPTWLGPKLKALVELPKDHKLNSILTEKLKECTARARAAMAEFNAGLESVRARLNESRIEMNRVKACDRASKARAKVKQVALNVAPLPLTANPEIEAKAA